MATTAQTQRSTSTVWISGEILTLLNKLVFPIVWFSLAAAILLFELVRTGGVFVPKGFGFIAVFGGFMTWLSAWSMARLERVGYSGRELVISNYWREVRVPFEQVQAVEPVWWYRRRMVRIRLGSRTPFGDTVYYIPKWAPLACFYSQPDEELRQLVSSDNLF